MANWNNPTVTSTYTDFVTEVKDRDLDAAKGLDPATVTVVNPVANMIRWSSSGGKWQKYDGATWNDLTSSYAINVTHLGGNVASSYASVVSPTFTGTPTAPTASAGTNTTQLATTAFVQGEKASPAFTGVPTAPTASAGTNTTQLATTAFVQGLKGTANTWSLAQTFSQDASVNGVTVGRGFANSVFNTAIGNNALALAGSGTGNTAGGYFSANGITNGNQNTAYGMETLLNTSTASYNTALGSLAGKFNTSGAQNTFVGSSAGVDGITGSNNACLGYNANPSSSSVSNTITLGNSSIATLRCQVTSITALSDLRDKSDIESLGVGLDFISNLKPVSFTWNMRDGAKVGIKDFGFIAQDLQQVQVDSGVTVPGLVYDDNPEKLEAAYGTLIPILVKAIQDLNRKVEILEAKCGDIS